MLLLPPTLASRCLIRFAIPGSVNRGFTGTLPTDMSLLAARVAGQHGALGCLVPRLATAIAASVRVPLAVGTLPGEVPRLPADLALALDLRHIEPLLAELV